MTGSLRTMDTWRHVQCARVALSRFCTCWPFRAKAHSILRLLAWNIPACVHPVCHLCVTSTHTSENVNCRNLSEAIFNFGDLKNSSPQKKTGQQSSSVLDHQQEHDECQISHQLQGGGGGQSWILAIEEHLWKKCAQFLNRNFRNFCSIFFFPIFPQSPR